MWYQSYIFRKQRERGPFSIISERKINISHNTYTERISSTLPKSESDTYFGEWSVKFSQNRKYNSLHTISEKRSVGNSQNTDKWISCTCSQTDTIRHSQNKKRAIISSLSLKVFSQTFFEYRGGSVHYHYLEKGSVNQFHTKTCAITAVI